jgi:putative ABC transport system permease protein
MTLREWQMCLEMGMIYGIVAVGLHVTFRIVDFPDLTCDGSFILGCATCAAMMKAGTSSGLALLATVFAGGTAGLCTGLLHTYGGISDLLSGILVAFVLYSVNLRVMGGLPNVVLESPTLFDNGTFPPLVVTTGVVCLVYTYFFMTDFGLALRSLGQNRRLSAICGVNVRFATLVALALSNATIGLAGGLFCQYQGFTDISQGHGTLVTALAAVIIGEKLLPRRGMRTVFFACVAGSVVYRIFVAWALHGDSIGLQTQDLNLITGLMIVGVMLFKKKKYRRAHAEIEQNTVDF